MLQKVIIGILALTVVGAAGVGVYDAIRQTSADVPSAPSDSVPVEVAPTQEPPREGEPVGMETEAAWNMYGHGGPDAQGRVTVTPGFAEGYGVGAGSADGTPGAQLSSDEWVTVTGVVLGFDQSDMIVQTDAGEELRVTMGPADFWQSQGVTLVPGDEVEILGFLWMDDRFMAAQVTKTATGEWIMLRDPNGMPLWGGPGNAGAEATGHNSQDGMHGNQDQGAHGERGGNRRGGGRGRGRADATGWAGQ